MKAISCVVVLVCIVLQHSFAQVSFKIPITLTNGTNSSIVRLGVNSGNTIGTDTSSSLGAFREVPAPPPPPPPYEWDTRIVTIPGRVSTFPTGLAGGVLGDYRGYLDPAQVDSFKIVISGDATDNAATTVSWPSNLASFGTAWTIKPQVGSDWPVTNMLTSPSVMIDAGLHKNIIIIKTGASGTNDVPSSGGLIPGRITLAQNYPNPFNPATTIRYEISGLGLVSLKIHDILGREVATLVNEVKVPGRYSVAWNADGFASGVYIYRLTTGGFSESRRMLLVR